MTYTQGTVKLLDCIEELHIIHGRVMLLDMALIHEPELAAGDTYGPGVRQLVRDVASQLDALCDKMEGIPKHREV